MNYVAAQWDLLSLLITSREYDEARDADWTPLSGADPATTRELVAAVSRYAETGEVQSFSVPADYPLWPSFRIDYYAATGQAERAFQIIDGLAGEGDHFSVAGVHRIGRIGDLLGNDPRYQALLEQAGIIW